MASIQFTAADRDDRGFVKAPASQEPRSLADLLPKPEAIKQDAARRQPWTRLELAMLAAVALLAVFVLIYAWTTPRTPTVPAAPRQTTVATLQPTSTSGAPTAAPVAIMLPAYAAPDGAQLGAIESTRALTPTAHYGDGWIQADVAGSGRIWLFARDWPDLPIVGPDLSAAAPAAAPPAVALCETEADIRFTTERDVIIEGLSRGLVVGRSCFSQDEADARAAALSQHVIAAYVAHPTPTTVPAPTPMSLTQKGATP